MGPISQSGRLFGWLALGAAMYHAIATLLLHWLVPEVNPLSDMVSAYLGTEYQLLSRSTFLALGCTLACIGLGLVGRIRPSLWLAISGVFVIIAVIGFFGVAAMPEAARSFRIPTQPATVLSIVLLSFLLRREPRWQPVGAILVGIAAALVTLFVLTIVLGILPSMGLGGLANRIVLVLIYVWVALTVGGLLLPSKGADAGAA